MRAVLAALMIGLVFVGAVAADEPVFDPSAEPRLSPGAQTRSIFSEFRIGGFGQVDGEKAANGSLGANAEVLFSKPLSSPDPWIDALLPRPHFGAEFNPEQGTGAGYAGFTWTFNLTERMFVEGSLGGAFGNSLSGVKDGLGDVALPTSCDFMFRQGATLGFQLTEQWSVMGTVERSSNAGLCDDKRNATNAGLKFGYKF